MALDETVKRLRAARDVSAALESPRLAVTLSDLDEVLDAAVNGAALLRLATSARSGSAAGRAARRQRWVPAEGVDATTTACCTAPCVDLGNGSLEAADGEYAELLRDANETARVLDADEWLTHGDTVRSLAAALRKVLVERDNAVIGQTALVRRLDERDAHIEREALKCGIPIGKAGDMVNDMSKRLRERVTELEQAEADLAREREAHEVTMRVYRDASAEVEVLKRHVEDGSAHSSRLCAEVERLKAAIANAMQTLGLVAPSPLESINEDAADRLRAQVETMVKLDAETLGRIILPDFDDEPLFQQQIAKEKAVRVAQAFARAMQSPGAIAAVHREADSSGYDIDRDDIPQIIGAALEHAGLHVAAEPEPRVTQSDIDTARAMTEELEALTARVRALKAEPVADGRACPVDPFAEFDIDTWRVGAVERFKVREEGAHTFEVCDAEEVQDLAMVVARLVDEVRRLGGGGR